jgi:hypothetical protein
MLLRYPRLDDQAIFWKVIRTSKNPQVLPIGKCRNFNSADDMAVLFQHHGHAHTRNLVSCYVDTCVFSSGMISNVYEPELTYGRFPTLVTAHAILVVLSKSCSPSLLSPMHFKTCHTETLQLNLKRLNETIATLHANYLSGNEKKMNRMRDYGLWLATTDERGHFSERCAEYVPHVPPLPSPLLHHAGPHVGSTGAGAGAGAGTGPVLSAGGSGSSGSGTGAGTGSGGSGTHSKHGHGSSSSSHNKHVHANHIRPAASSKNSLLVPTDSL